MTTLVSKLQLTSGLFIALTGLQTTDLKNLNSKRVGEVWASCAGTTDWFKDWALLIRLMIENGIVFRDCDPRNVDLKAVTVKENLAFFNDPSLYRLFNLYGPAAIEMYDYLTVADLEKALPHFTLPERAALKQFLINYWPNALMLSEL